MDMVSRIPTMADLADAKHYGCTFRDEGRNIRGQGYSGTASGPMGALLSEVPWWAWLLLLALLMDEE